MSEASRAVLDAFEKLSPECQVEVAEEILRRTRLGGDDEDWLHQAADDLFRSFDAEENSRASGA
jgi:hypothetical protein